jgi:lysyl endopeptidase
LDRHIPRRALVTALAILVSLFSVTALAVPVNIVKADLRSLIRAAIDSPVQFAVLVPHPVSTATGGKWSVAGGRATWRYSVRVPTAVSLSFHAIQSSLPESAILVVRGAKTTTSYRVRDLHRGELWSRIHPGDALELTLTVAAADRADVALNIVSLQAGYRSVGPGVEDHPYYRQLMSQAAAASGNAACVTNYECQVTASNTPPGAATVALVIGNQYQCSGSLINDIPGDNTPYILTARHCETGQLGGGNPSAASLVTVYWDATTSCGATLGSIYDGNIQTQTGAQTMVEQQDAWLIKLDASPVVSDAQFAGFDASGGAVQGGYTIQHAEGYDKQFTGWFGQAAAIRESNVLGSTYVSNFWETVNQTGNIGPGASGSGLFDQNSHLVGSLTLGRQTSDASGYGACPVTNPPAPNGTNGVADFTALWAVWNSTADTTSTTGNTTLKSVLDPGNTGTVVVPSEPAAAIEFSPLTTDIFFVAASVQLTWNAANATQCTASGGTAGDGWSGTLTNAGSQMVTEAAAATVTYTLTCAFPGGRSASASMSLAWVVQPQVQFNVPYVVWTTRPALLSWSSNVTPCSITGGGLSMSNLPASGTTTTTQSTPGEVTYQLSCGPSNNQDTLIGAVQYVTPSLIFEANGTDRLLGETFFLQWITQADSCVPSGGAPNDGWATTAFGQNDSSVQFSPNVTAAGTYTYTLTCSSGPISLQQSATVTFENNAPYVTASISPSSATFSDSPADYATVTWNSNLSNCNVLSSPNLPDNGPGDPPFDVGSPFFTVPLPQGTLTFAPAQSGDYTLSVSCIPKVLNPAVTSAPLTLTVLPPPPPTAAISINPSTVLAGQSFAISWSSSNTSTCRATGGIPGGEFSGTQPSAGTVAEVAQSGQFTFAVTCQSIDPALPAASAQASLNIQALTTTLTPSTVSVTKGSSFTLTWSSVAATSCVASGGGANGGTWSGSVGTSGTLTQTASTVGTFTYALVCSAGGSLNAAQAVTVTVSAPSSSNGSGSTESTGSDGSKGGGGALGALELALLAALRGSRWARSRASARRRGRRTSHASP